LIKLEIIKQTKNHLWVIIGVREHLDQQFKVKIVLGGPSYPQ